MVWGRFHQQFEERERRLMVAPSQEIGRHLEKWLEEVGRIRHRLLAEDSREFRPAPFLRERLNHRPDRCLRGRRLPGAEVANHFLLFDRPDDLSPGLSLGEAGDCARPVPPASSGVPEFSSRLERPLEQGVAVTGVELRLGAVGVQSHELVHRVIEVVRCESPGDPPPGLRRRLLEQAVEGRQPVGDAVFFRRLVPRRRQRGRKGRGFRGPDIGLLRRPLAGRRSGQRAARPV